MKKTICLLCSLCLAFGLTACDMFLPVSDTSSVADSNTDTNIEISVNSVDSVDSATSTNSTDSVDSAASNTDTDSVGGTESVDSTDSTTGATGGNGEIELPKDKFE